MKHRFLTVTALAALVAAGAVAALTLAPAASAWDWQALPGGYTYAAQPTTVDGKTCNQVRVGGVGVGVFNGNDCDPGFQAGLDAFVNSTICRVNPAAGGSACPQPTTAPASAPPATTTDTPPAAPPTQTVVGTVTVTVTQPLTPVEQSLSDQLAALAAQVQALTDRVTILEKASDAALLAMQQALENGSSPAEAAAIARGTALNVIYGLGEFAG